MTALTDATRRTERRRPFLRARWSNLILLTFVVPDEVLGPYLHPALELDRWQDRAHVSLVAFDFQDTRVRSRRIPGFVNFPELNLRTYVRYHDQLGVLFVREFVPSRIVALVARLRYNEPYTAIDMSSNTVGQGHDLLRVEHHWRHNGAAGHIKVTGPQQSVLPSDASAYPFKERRRGFGVSRRGELVSYRVEHPEWAVRGIHQLDYRVDFASLYGGAWGFLNEATPVQTTFAVGSAVEVFPPGR